MTELDIEAFNAGRDLEVALPTKVRVMIYKSSQHAGWNTHVMFNARDTLTGKSAAFGSTNTWATEPTMRDIADHICEQMRHEVEEVLGLDPHAAVAP